MEEIQEPTSKLKRVFLIFKQKLRPQPSGDANEERIRRRKALVQLLTRRLTAIKVTLFIIGYLWMLVIPFPGLGRNTYIDENALQPSQVKTYWDWDNVHAADIYLAQLEEIRDANFTSKQRAQFISTEFLKLGLSSSTQNYAFSASTANINGTNAYAILRSPRNPGTEAMVISAPWLSRIGDVDGTLNLRGISTVLALAAFLKHHSYWAKDIVFVISDGYLDGMQAWLGAYHGSEQYSLQAEPLSLCSGVIWTALNIDYPGHSFSHLGIFFEGLNGRLPNQDLLNSFERIARFTGGVPVTIYDHIDLQEQLPKKSIYNIAEVKSYLYQAKNVARHLRYQATGRGSGVHGLFHQFRIDAITLFAIPAQGPHGFHALGKSVESTLRTMNNLLERLHASFFFYIMTGPERFLKIGYFLPSAILISVAMMFHGLSTWVNAAWIHDTHSGPTEKKNSTSSSTPPTIKWKNRRRPVIAVLGIMISTHLLGLLLFWTITRSWFMEKYQVLSPVLFIILTAIPCLFLTVPSPDTSDTASISTVLKALNLCFASTVISITSVLNFPLAGSLAVILGIPLVMSSPSPSVPIRILKYTGYACLSHGWLFFGQKEMWKAVWNWEILLVWFAPFICIVYVPLVLQAGISCLIPL